MTHLKFISSRLRDSTLDKLSQKYSIVYIGKMNEVFRTHTHLYIYRLCTNDYEIWWLQLNKIYCNVLWKTMISLYLRFLIQLIDQILNFVFVLLAPLSWASTRERERIERRRAGGNARERPGSKGHTTSYNAWTDTAAGSERSDGNNKIICHQPFAYVARCFMR